MKNKIFLSLAFITLLAACTKEVSETKYAEISPKVGILANHAEMHNITMLGVDYDFNVNKKNLVINSKVRFHVKNPDALEKTVKIRYYAALLKQGNHSLTREDFDHDVHFKKGEVEKHIFLDHELVVSKLFSKENKDLELVFGLFS
jgi:hypothetical protein